MQMLDGGPYLEEDYSVNMVILHAHCNASMSDKKHTNKSYLSY